MTDEFWRADNTLRHDPLDDAWTVVTRNRRVLSPAARARATEGPATAAQFDASDAIVSLPNLGERLVKTSDGRDASVQVVPSPTPVVFVEQPTFTPNAFSECGALGAHELLVVKSAANDARVQDIGPQAFAAIFDLWAERVRDLAKDIRLHRIGLSLGPPSARRSPLCAAHVLALPLSPKNPPSPVDDCRVCSAVAEAKAAGRVVFETPMGVAWVPFAPKNAFHVRVAAAEHGALVADTSGTLAGALGALVAQSVAALDLLSNGGDFSVDIAPVALRAVNGHVSHCVVDVFATDTVDAAAFLGQELRVSPLAPEDTAAQLRGVAAGEGSA